MNTALNLDQPTSISYRMLKSDIFQSLYDKVMATVEATAAYLDGPGRVQSSILDTRARADYTRLSMALTTHLMQLASKALLLRSIRNGDVTLDYAKSEFVKMETKNRTELSVDGTELVPEQLVDLIKTSIDLRVKIGTFEANLMNPAAAVTVSNAVHRQLSLVAQAFAH